MKKILLCLAFMLMIPATSYAKKPKMCVSDWPLWETIHAMSELNQLDEFDFRYERYETCINLFQAGVTDLAFMSLYEFIALQRQDNNGIIIAATDYSAGGDGIVLRENVTSLKGKTIALQTNSLGLYLMHLYLKKQDLSLNDIRLLNVAAERVSASFLKTPSLAGLVGWNPYMDDAINGGGKLAATSADFPENIFDLVVINKRSLDTNRELYIDFLKKYFAAVNNPDVLEKMAELTKVSVSEFQVWLTDSYNYKTASDSLTSFPRMKQVAHEVQEFFKVAPKTLKGKARNAFGDIPLDIEPLFDESFLKELITQEPENKPQVDTAASN